MIGVWRPDGGCALFLVIIISTVADLEVNAAAESADGEVDDGDDTDRDIHTDGQCSVNGLQSQELITAGVLVDDHQTQQR